MRSLLLLAVFSGSAFGWGCEGHEMVALIARAHLTPRASAEVDRLLRANPIDPALNRYCKDRPADLMADSSTWADDVRNIEKTSAWHFINIPRPVEHGDYREWCKPVENKPGCIVTALEAQWAILRDKSQPDAERARSLRYVIHFAGDIAQPLHDTENHDQGGNCTSITFFSDERPERLHSIWDTLIIQRELEAHKQTVAGYAHTLDDEFHPAQSSLNIADWAWEGHRLASEVAYGDLKPGIPVAPPDLGEPDKAGCDAERAAIAALHISVGDEYVSQALPVIRAQLAKAGYRLAALLNQTFP